MIYDLVVDTFDEDLLEAALAALGGARIIRDPKDNQEPYLTSEGYLVVRLKDGDPIAYAREIQRRVRSIRIVGTYDRTPTKE